MKNLDAQVQIYSLDTSCFYNAEEVKLDRQLIRLKQLKGRLSKQIQPLNQLRLTQNKLLKLDKESEDYETVKTELESKIIDLNKQIEKMVKSKVERVKKKLDKRLEQFEAGSDRYNSKAIANEKVLSKLDQYKPMLDDYSNVNEKSKLLKINKESKLYKSNKYLEGRINALRKKLDEEAKKQKGQVRTLRSEKLKDKNIISQFTSTLTRTLKIRPNEISTDIIVVRAYRYKVFKELVEQGFINENGDRYEYLTSSAGGIRQKKSMFIKSEIWKKHKNALTGGLTREKINKRGQMNINKYNAYLALCMSASVKWEGFDIDKCIVVDDFETQVNGMVEYLDHKESKIHVPKPMDIPINHVDGAGICLLTVSEKSFQFRMPYFKGMMIPFPIHKFLDEVEGASPIVKDVYGKEWNVIEDGISIIFTKSQFKAWSYFKSWDEYKKNFKKYKCEAAKCKEEEDNHEDKPLSYQVLQTLNNMEKKDLEYFAKDTVEHINKIGTDLDEMLKLLGVDKEKKYGFERAVEIYPNLINDTYSKEVIKEKRLSLIKEAKAGKLLLKGTKRTYIAPDLFAFAEWLFCGIEKPTGLLKDGEVSCSLFKNQKVDVLRSPHLYREHYIAENTIGEVKVNGVKVSIQDWFITKDIYTSVHSLCSKLLMFDVDGDDALIVSDSRFVTISEEHMKGIYPLEYQLGTADKKEITNENIYKSLKAAYSKNIGEVSNDITKIFNNPNPDLSVVKWLCYRNNAIIDYAKCLWMPKFSPEIEKTIKDATSGKVPYFFQYAKGKKWDQVEAKNSSVVNMLDEIIPDNNIHFKEVIDDLDYCHMMKDKNRVVDEEVETKIKDLYEKLNKNKYKDIKKQLRIMEGTKRKKVELFVYKQIRKKLLRLGKKDQVVDVLVKYLYTEKKDNSKQTLWYVFGNEIAKNLERNIKGIKRCEDVGCWNEIEHTKAKRFCEGCAARRKLSSKRKWKNTKSRKNKVS